MISLTIIDWGIWILYFLLGLFVLILYQNGKFKEKPTYLVPGYVLKMFGGLAFSLVYLNYYNGGDTTEYFKASSVMTEVLSINPSKYFDLLFSDHTEAPTILKSVGKTLFFSESPEEWLMVRILTPINLIGLNSYLGVTIFFSILSFMGSVALYNVMKDLLKNQERLIFIVNFVIPSALFWGSGILKDTISFFGFALCINYFYNIHISRGNWKINIVLLALIGFVIFNLKAYIVLSVIPWVFVVLFYGIKNRIKAPILKITLMPFIFVVSTAFAIFSLTFLMDSSESYKTDKIFNNIQGFHSWHTTLGGSSYNLGQIDYTLIGILSKFPEAVNVTLFRPYPWEAGSAIILLSSLESGLFLIFTVFVLIWCRLKFFTILFKNPFVFGAFVYSMLFSFSIGLTSYNFGALSRFKIPIIPIISFILIFVLCKYNEERREKQLKNK